MLALIDHELRFQPGRLLAYKMLRDGAIGKVRHAKATFQGPHRGDPNVPWNWWSDSLSGGGALGAIGSHIIDSFHWLLATDISSVSCQLQTHVRQRSDADGNIRAVTSDDASNLVLRFNDGQLTDNTTGVATVSMTDGPEFKNVIELFGTDGSMKIDHRGEVALATGRDRLDEHRSRPRHTAPRNARHWFCSCICRDRPADRRCDTHWSGRDRTRRDLRRRPAGSAGTRRGPRVGRDRASFHGRLVSVSRREVTFLLRIC